MRKRLPINPNDLILLLLIVPLSFVIIYICLIISEKIFNRIEIGAIISIFLIVLIYCYFLLF